ncbi:unnamed protein product [Timema podura]|uniref:Uncharacterized protein n=1 Tax=Timema podura TaxID=61482 RepID=A0ABN7PRT4_TIMPD|nr:unnamed protein product [Timema podura]
MRRQTRYIQRTRITREDKERMTAMNLLTMKGCQIKKILAPKSILTTATIWRKNNIETASHNFTGYDPSTTQIATIMTTRLMDWDITPLA